MRAKVARRIRKIIYGDRPHNDRRYYRNTTTGSIVADKTRRTYQAAKKQYLSKG